MKKNNVYGALLLNIGLLLGAEVYGQTTTNIYPANGNVGLGTTSPISKLHVIGDIMIPEGNSILLRGNDRSHQLAYCSENENNLVDGPGLFGWNGGILGTQKGGIRTMALRWDGRGYVGIGTYSPTEMLSVNGNIRAHQIKVETSNWPDYVFDEDYKLASLAETEKFIKENGHLPEVPKAETVEKEGYSLNEMDKILLKKIEEITLHLIQKNKEVTKQQEEIDKLKSVIEQIQTEIQIKK